MKVGKDEEKKKKCEESGLRFWVMFKLTLTLCVRQENEP